MKFMTAWKRSLMKRMDRILSLLSLSAKGRNLVSGEFMAEKAIKEGTAKVVIVSEDASENTKKHFRDMCNYRKIPVFFYATKEELDEMREAQKSLLDAEERILSAEYDTKMCEISLLQISGKVTLYLK